VEHAPNALEWSNILTLVGLLFTLPVSNGKLERIFSTLKILKVDKQSSLGNDLLDDLLVLNTDCISLKEFSPITVSICGGMPKLDAPTSSLERNTGDIPQKLPTQRMVTLPTAMQRLITFHPGMSG